LNVTYFGPGFYFQSLGQIGQIRVDREGFLG